MGISISTTPARLGIERTPESFGLQIQNAKLEYKQNHAKVKLETKQSKILIDQYQCFAEEGLKNNSDFAREQAQNGYQKVMEYIAKVAQNGDAMAKIGHKANIMIDIARRGSVTTHEFGMGTMPMSRPQIDVDAGYLKIDFEPKELGLRNGVEGNYIPGGVSYSYTPAELNIKMLSYGSVDIKYTGNNVDSSV